MHRLAMSGLMITAAFLASSDSRAQSTASPGAQPGVSPMDAWTCPLTHPIKGNFTTYSGEPCIYHMSGGQFYEKTMPERCYATEEEARRGGCRRSKV
jgi:hypothetical protein